MLTLCDGYIFISQLLIDLLFFLNLIFELYNGFFAVVDSLLAHLLCSLFKWVQHTYLFYFCFVVFLHFLEHLLFELRKFLTTFLCSILYFCLAWKNYLYRKWAKRKVNVYICKYLLWAIARILKIVGSPPVAIALSSFSFVNSVNELLSTNFPCSLFARLKLKWSVDLIY